MDERTILGITLHFPSAQGIFNAGAFATVAAFMGYFFVILTMIWIGYSLYAAYKIVLSKGEEKDMETGMTLVKNVWVSISWGMVFFMALSIIGSVIGIGNVTEWNTQLAQCKSASGGFYFRDKAAQQSVEIPTDEMHCCIVSESMRLAPGQYAELDFIKGSSHFIGVAKGGTPPAIFTDCEEY